MPDLLSLEQLRQALPAIHKQVYLNTGTFGPLPVAGVTAMQEYLQHELDTGRLSVDTFERIIATYASARKRVAHLLHADEDEIALTDNTGEGLNIICYGLNWQAGDEIITTNHEHFSLLAPLYQLRERYGVVIRVADLGPYAERSLVEAVGELVNEHTRLIACSHVTWTNGTRLDLVGLGSLGQDRHIPVLIDGAQSAGAIPLDMHALADVDFYAIPGQKWLCGPDGTGALYVRREALAHITSTYVGYWSAEHDEEWKLQADARRFEVGGRQTAAIAGQAAALNWLEETVGYEHIYQRIAQLHTYASASLEQVPGLTLLSHQSGLSGLLTFSLADADPEKLVTSLREQHNIVTRTIPEMQAVRISTGFYNTEAEIDLLVQALTAWGSATDR